VQAAVFQDWAKLSLKASRSLEWAWLYSAADMDGDDKAKASVHGAKACLKTRRMNSAAWRV
jgi:hypothetical protein